MSVARGPPGAPRGPSSTRSSAAAATMIRATPPEGFGAIGARPHRPRAAACGAGPALPRPLPVSGAGPFVPGEAPAALTACGPARRVGCGSVPGTEGDRATDAGPSLTAQFRSPRDPSLRLGAEVRPFQLCHPCFSLSGLPELKIEPNAGESSSPSAPARLSLDGKGV